MWRIFKKWLVVSLQLFPYTVKLTFSGERWIRRSGVCSLRTKPSWAIRSLCANSHLLLTSECCVTLSFCFVLLLFCFCFLFACLFVFETEFLGVGIVLCFWCFGWLVGWLVLGGFSLEGIFPRPLLNSHCFSLSDARTACVHQHTWCHMTNVLTILGKPLRMY